MSDSDDYNPYYSPRYYPTSPQYNPTSPQYYPTSPQTPQYYPTSPQYNGYARSPIRSKSYPYKPIDPVIRLSAPSLQDIASATIAISLWKHENIPRALSKADKLCTTSTSSWNSLEHKVNQLPNDLPIPTRVKEQIRQYVDKVRNQIVSWVQYHFRSVFVDMEKDKTVYNHVYDLIWHSDGTINYVETARKISKLKSPRLSDLEKYRFLCTYCLKDEMQPMSSDSDLFSDIFKDHVSFKSYPLIGYWNSYFSDDLQSIPTIENESLDSFMFQHRYVDNWPAKEYFFDRLSPQEQIQNAIRLIDKKGIVYQKILLMKLNESQRMGVYLERSVQIITNYAKTSDNWEDLLEVWSDIRTIITGDQFVSIFSELLSTKAVSRVFIEIWTSVNDDLKNYLLGYDEYDLVERILYSFRWSEDIDFIILVLQDLDQSMKSDCKMRIFVPFCEYLFSQPAINFQWFDRVTKAYCGKNSKQFKDFFTFECRRVKFRSLEFYSSGDLKGLNFMLVYHLSLTPDRILEYKKQLLEWETSIMKLANFFDSRTEFLNEIINDALPTTGLRTEYRKKLVSSLWAFETLTSLLAKNGLDKVKNVVDSFLTSERDRKKLKKALLDNSSELIYDSFVDSDGSYLQSVLLWVFEKKNLVNEFKSTIPLDNIFDSLLRQAVFRNWCFGKVKSDLNADSFVCCNRFLTWYFRTPLQVKKYKLSRIFSYAKIDTITTLLECKQYSQLKIVMSWFFENDKVEIEKFKKKYQFYTKILRAV